MPEALGRLADSEPNSPDTDSEPNGSDADRAHMAKIQDRKEERNVYIYPKSTIS